MECESLALVVWGENKTGNSARERMQLESQSQSLNGDDFRKNFRSDKPLANVVFFNSGGQGDVR